MAGTSLINTIHSRRVPQFVSRIEKDYKNLSINIGSLRCFIYSDGKYETHIISEYVFKYEGEKHPFVEIKEEEKHLLYWYDKTPR
jgi:hypothetical protein